MSSVNPPPGGPPHPQWYPAPPTPPQAPQPPRWAWWVVGIVIPVVGLLVTLLVSRPNSSDDRADENVAPTPTRSSASADAADQEQPAPAPPKSPEAQTAQKALYGPETVDADTTNSGSYIDLDGSGPIVMGDANKSADIIFGASLGLFVPGSASNLAPLPDSGAAPTAVECADAVQEAGTYTADAKPGGRFCLMTGKGRVAYLKVVTAPSVGTGKLNITVWDTPGA
ncbi:hypothetical protein ACKI1I_18110 [Streptomyces turgidiscabies]|uniref:hypothetical protein n=1 Tax=Streptomyces TaxID=1883 RepID=UPI00031A3EB7|nr:MULTISPECIES: hypothetical protein [Streptomyces]MDX3497967.1 hypothetical protein [Streptomyces turgidiscabies]GAQ69875.1 hypothetical protein T45_01606 [Streptomyces turgidiscabies]